MEDRSAAIDLQALTTTNGSSLVDLERLEAMALFAGGVAHDIANLAGAVRLTAQAALQATNDPAMRGQLEAIEHCSKLTEGLVTMLLEHHRPTDRGPIPVDLSALVEEKKRMLRILAGRRVKLVFELERVPPIVACPLELMQAITNLITNSAEAIGAAGGTIWIRTKFDGESVHLEVQDDGPGFEAYAREHAAQPFFSTKTGGYGLGMSLVSRVARTYDGRMWINSPLDRGATVGMVFMV